jgi:hypothetical protein
MSSSHVSAPLPSSVIELLRDTGAAAAAASGQVHIVSVSAIRDALGSRWPRRSAGIEDFVERGFRRGALADDLIVRLNPVDFILVQPSWPPLGALNRAMQLMRDTLSYFLGEVRPENIRVAVVDQLLGDAIQARSVAPTAQTEGSAATLRNLVDSTDGSPPWERFAAGAAMSDPVLVRRPDGGDLEAMFYLEPVWNLASGAVASFLVQSVVFELAPDGTRSPPCWTLFTPRCHLALVESRIDYLARELEAEPSLVAHLPISASCLRLTSTRFRLLSKLRRCLPDERRKQTIIELRDRPPGFPESALAALVAQVAPYARAVLARARPTGSTCGLRGPVCEVPAGLDGAALTRELERFGADARKVCLPTAAYGLSRRSQILAARAAGITHIAGSALTEVFGCDLKPRRFQLGDLYASREQAPRAAVA